jgi:hypothetical protein
MIFERYQDSNPESCRGIQTFQATEHISPSAPYSLHSTVVEEICLHTSLAVRVSSKQTKTISV